MNKFLIASLLAMCIIGFSMSSVNADPVNVPGEIHFAPAKYGAAGHPNHDSVNGIKFTDNAWQLAYVGNYELIFYSKGYVISDINDKITVGSDTQKHKIPLETTGIEIRASSTNRCSYQSDHLFFSLAQNNISPSEISGGAKFDGITLTRNFRAKLATNNGQNIVLDTGYVSLRSTN